VGEYLDNLQANSEAELAKLLAPDSEEKQQTADIATTNAATKNPIRFCASRF